MRIHQKFILAVTLLCAGIFCTARALSDTGPGAGPDVTVALNKALYDLSLVSVEQGSGVVGVKGSMYYEQDDACDAWTTDQRFTIEYQYPEQRPVNDTNHYVAWESKDGNHLEFNSEREENGQVSELLRGSVVRGADGAAKAVYSRPGNLSFYLPKGFFLPTPHTNEIIRHARKGDTMFDAVLFDGTDSDGPVEVSTVIEKKLSPADIKKIIKDASGKVDAALLTPDAWLVRMAFFPLKDQDEPTPSYEMEMTLHDNGIVSHAIIDYKTFKVEQKLKTIEAVIPKKCG